MLFYCFCFIFIVDTIPDVLISPPFACVPPPPSLHLPLSWASGQDHIRRTRGHTQQGGDGQNTQVFHKVSRSIRTRGGCQPLKSSPFLQRLSEHPPASQVSRRDSAVMGPLLGQPLDTKSDSCPERGERRGASHPGWACHTMSHLLGALPRTQAFSLKSPTLLPRLLQRRRSSSQSPRYFGGKRAFLVFFLWCPRAHNNS